MERTGLIQFAGKDALVLRPDIEVGQTAPEFTAYMPALGLEPDYDAVLAAAQAAL